MTDTEKKIAVMQTFVEGKTIQYKAVDATIWHDVVEPLWDWDSKEYRIKPESICRPYKDTDEMIAGFKERFEPKHIVGGVMCVSAAMPFIWIKHKELRSKKLIIGFDDKEIICGGCLRSLKFVFENYTYLDGSPCGKLVEE